MHWSPQATPFGSQEVWGGMAESDGSIYRHGQERVDKCEIKHGSP